MLSPEMQPRFLSEQECKENATREILSFITLPDTKEGEPPDVRPAPGAPSFSFDDLSDKAFVDGPELFNWKSRDVYDVDGLLLFRTQTLTLSSGDEWHVCSAASNLLQRQAWCVCSDQSPALSDETLIAKALLELRRHHGLEPFIVGDEDVRLVSYSYPYLGILCYSRSNPDARFIFKLDEPLIIPVEPYRHSENTDSLTLVWSPYDSVARHTFAHFRRLWEQNMALLPRLPNSRKDLPGAIRAARKSVRDEHIVKPVLKLIPQETDKTCAVATALMLLKHHGIELKTLEEEHGVTHDQIATNMKCKPDGAPPEEQVREVNRLLALVGSKLKAEPDGGPSFDKAQAELSENRPFKIGGGHARAVAGTKAQLGGKDWLWIFDPLPVKKGRTCCEAWTEGTPRDFMYVRPPKSPG